MRCGIFAEQVHHDKRGNYIGETSTAVFGQKKHYSADHGHIGETWNSFIGDTTDLSEVSELSDNQGGDDSFDDSEW